MLENARSFDVGVGFGFGFGLGRSAADPLPPPAACGPSDAAPAVATVEPASSWATRAASILGGFVKVSVFLMNG